MASVLTQIQGRNRWLNQMMMTGTMSHNLQQIITEVRNIKKRTSFV